MAKTIAIFVVVGVLAGTAAAASSCIVNKFDYPADGPSDKNCNRCQWQCLTDQQCSTAVMNGTTYDRNILPTFNCGDGYFTLPRNGTVAGLCVMLNATGAIIDTQEQGCDECTHQCFYWSECTTMVYNYVVVPKTDNLLGYCPITPLFPGSGPTPIPSAPVGRKLLADFDDLDVEFSQ
jgi:hypothetical protein